MSQDDVHLESLFDGLNGALSTVSDTPTCGISENWSPILTSCALHLMNKKNFEFSFLVTKEPCVRTLPESLQGLDAYNLTIQIVKSR